MTAPLLEAARAAFGLDLTTEQAAACERYAILLAEWNGRLNLTAIRDPEEVRRKHFLDSFSCALAFAVPPESLVDVGSGAGFPGLALKILYPNLRLTLVESVGKKAKFIELVVQDLGLKDVTVLPRRAEEVGQDPAHRAAYQWAVARAVAQLPVLAEYLLPLVQVGGAMLAQKGSSAPQEARAAGRALQTLGGGPPRLVPVAIPGLSDERFLVIAEKLRPTPAQYPRLPGTPAKKPL